MYTNILHSDVQKFIVEHEEDDEKHLVLKHRFIHGAPSSLVAQQILARRKAKSKLPLFYNTTNIIYPAPVNLEQSSSEQTALLKLSFLAKHNINNSIVVDLTGGYGVDTFFLSKFFDKVIYIELNLSLLKIAQHNHMTLGATHIEYRNMSAENFVDEAAAHFDLIYIDPSRRDRANKKVYRLKDCEPNIVYLQDKVFEKSRWLLLKASPLLDIYQGLQELHHVKEVFVVSLHNECKEVLFICDQRYNASPLISAINITSNNIESFSFNLDEEKNKRVHFSTPKKFIYEPNASVLKAGAFKCLGSQFGLYKLHPNTHLYTSDVLQENFPGRIFETKGYHKKDKKLLEKFFNEGKANIIIRNFPSTVEDIKKKLKLKDGGEKYLVAFSSMNEKFICMAERLK